MIKTCDTCSEHVDMSIHDEEPWFACGRDNIVCENWVPWDYEGPFMGPEYEYEEENK